MIQQLTNNLFYILSGTLLFLVLSSKNILIYNEELLIALSFLAFIVTSASTMGDAIAETFQTRATHIQDELQAFFHTKETMLKEVKHHIQLQQKIAQSVMALGAIVLVNVETIHTQRAQAVRNTVQTQAVTQLQNMMTQQHALQAHLHSVTCHAYKHVMLDAMLLQKKTMQTLCMQNALELIGTMKRKDTAQKTSFSTTAEQTSQSKAKKATVSKTQKTKKK